MRSREFISLSLDSPTRVRKALGRPVTETESYTLQVTSYKLQVRKALGRGWGASPADGADAEAAFANVISR
jgi:hypothetical protein